MIRIFCHSLTAPQSVQFVRSQDAPVGLQPFLIVYVLQFCLPAMSHFHPNLSCLLLETQSTCQQDWRLLLSPAVSVKQLHFDSITATSQAYAYNTTVPKLSLALRPFLTSAHMLRFYTKLP